MPLLDHFHPPWSVRRPWEGIHGSWAAKIVDALNEDLLPPDYFAMPVLTVGGQVQVDVGTFQEGNGTSPGTAAGVATAAWAPPRPALVTFVDFKNLDVFEVRIMQDFGGPQLRGAIELVSPANKDRPSSRRAFAVKCAGYLAAGASVIVIDVVTERSANLHAELLEVLKLAGDLAWQSPSGIYAVAYRTATSADTQRMEVWPESLAVGAPLPTLPLWLAPDLCLPLRLEESYRATCASLRIRDG
jgi:hypothetical protein